MINIILAYIGLIAIGAGGLIILFFGGLGDSMPTFILGFGILTGACIFILLKMGTELLQIPDSITLFAICGITGIACAAIITKLLLFNS